MGLTVPSVCGAIEQMLNIFDSEDETLDVSVSTRPDVTLALTKGAMRLLRDMGYAVIPEFALPNGRRADVIGIARDGRILIAEVKSCQADFDADTKWPDYIEFCDHFFFVTDTEFPGHLLPEIEGHIVADAWGGAVKRFATERPLASARRKALTLKLARNAAQRLYIPSQS